MTVRPMRCGFAVALLVAAFLGCLSPAPVSVGGACEKNDDCAEGNWCLGRVCRADPGQQPAADAGVYHDASTPPDAGVDAGGDAGPRDTGHDSGQLVYDAGIDAAVDAETPDAGDDAGQNGGDETPDASDGGSTDACMGGTIFVAANPTHVPANGVTASTVSAAPHSCDVDHEPDGTLVTFNAAGDGFTWGGAGSVTMPTVSGIASASITSTTAGMVIATASFRTASGVVLSDSVNVQFTVPVCGPTGGRGAIALDVSPVSIPADGVSSTSLAAVAKYCDKTTVKNGTQVSFETTGGTFTGGGRKATLLSSGGVATINLTSSTTVGPATVTASFTDPDGVAVTVSKAVAFTAP